MSLRSCLYLGRVEHARTQPIVHRFAYRVMLCYLDLDELEQVFAGRWLWSTRRRAVARFRRQDYLGPAELPLAEAVRQRAEQLCGVRPQGPIRMLTQLRYWGYVFNPVTFYYCFQPDGQLQVVLAEITNTPWGERHCYAVEAQEGVAERRFAKQFHVSPFLPMDLDYDWRLPAPGERLSAAMTLRRAGEVVFTAGMALQRRAITGGALAAALLRHPCMTLKVILGIHWQALRLWCKGAVFHRHPQRRRTASP